VGVSPEEQIRRYLEGHGRATDATVRHVLETFGVSPEDEEGRKRIVAALARAGIEVRPSLMGLSEDAAIRVLLSEPAPGQRPEAIARQIVERHGGSYTVTVRELLGLFGLEQLTQTAREGISIALVTVDVGTQPNLAFVKGDDDQVRLFANEPEEPAQGPGPAAGGEDAPDASLRPSSAPH
jgi:hypothetical protein